MVVLKLVNDPEVSTRIQVDEVWIQKQSALRFVVTHVDTSMNRVTLQQLDSDRSINTSNDVLVRDFAPESDKKSQPNRSK